MKSSEHDNLIRFHASWKARLTYPTKSWGFILMAVMFLGTSLLTYIAVQTFMTALNICISGTMFFITLWMTYKVRILRYDGFMSNYHAIMFAIMEKPTDKQYQQIFWDYERFIGINQAMKLNQIVMKLRQIPGSIHYDGENKTGYELAYGLEDSLEDLAKRHQKTVEIIEKHS